jgi:hypothetical protein
VARRMIEDMLVRQARAVLDFNWTGEYTMPGPRLYPHQWSWDAAFIAIGYSSYDQERATRGLRHLFEAQWKNGLLPQLVFNPHFTERDPFVVQTTAPTVSGSWKAPRISRERSGQSLTLSRSIL